MTMTVRIDGLCPACGSDRLYATSPDGSDERMRIECDATSCPNPDLVQQLLSKPDQHVHLIDFREDGYTAQHPLAERIRPESLFACDLTDEFRVLTEPPGIGMYRVPPGGSLADAEPVDRDSVLFEVPSAPPSDEARQRVDLREMLPLGTIHVMPSDQPVPEGFMEVDDPEVRLPRAEYPDLAAAIDAAGFDTLMIDGVEHVAIDLPSVNLRSTERLILRVR